ncbi:TVP38/TMEM64 family protein [Celeribacter arenosi]|uniref:TVP38/TMEM64 family protein n=1 Tax=Celeribacter arenosi TaxID=792649 RepID=A0ABP7K7X2_9RHOB
MDQRTAGVPLSRLLPLLGLVSAGIVLGIIFRDKLSFDTLAENHAALVQYRDAHFAQVAVVFVALYAGIVTFSLPGATVATLTGGFLFGLFPGVIFNVVAATVGASLLFLAARWGLGDWLSARIDTSEGRIHQLKKGIDENQWSMLFFIRFVPIVPFFVANLIPALLGVPFHRFVVSTFLGIMPGALVYTSLGSGLGSILESGGRPDLGIIFEPYILFPLLALSVLALIPALMRKRKKEA